MQVQTGYVETDMIAGIVLILAGLLLVIYPPLLSLIVAVVLIMLGGALTAIAWQERKLQRHYRNPVVEFFIRY
jgi:uncharacterized membrane protein HdeD (DUF308 family)